MRARASAATATLAAARHSRGREVEYEIKAAEKARGASPRKYAEGDARRAGCNPCNAGSKREAEMWPSTLDPKHIAANSKAMTENKPAPFKYARGTYRLDPSDTRPRSVRRQSYKAEPQAVAA